MQYEAEEQARKNADRKQSITKGEEQLTATERQIKNLEIQLSGLGIFKGKEKKALREQIDALQGKMPRLRSDAEAERKTLLSSIESEGKKISDSVRAKKEIIQQCSEDKDRASAEIDANNHVIEETEKGIAQVKNKIFTRFKEHLITVSSMCLGDLAQQSKLADAKIQESEKALTEAQE